MVSLRAMSNDPMIPFTGNPLDRASEKRTDAAWIEA